MNQAVSFGLLLGGGLLLTSALTGNSLSEVAKGNPGTVSKTGADVGGPGSSGVAGLGTAGAAAVNAATGAATDPVQAKNLTVERIDQGRDFADTGGTIVSPEPGKIVAVVPVGQGWEGGGAIVEQLADGSYMYVEEGVQAIAHVGETVAQGQIIADLIPDFHSGVEIGYAAPTSNPGANYIGNGYETLAQSTTGYVEGEVTKAGQEFANWLSSLGFGK